MDQHDFLFRCVFMQKIMATFQTSYRTDKTQWRVGHMLIVYSQFNFALVVELFLKMELRVDFQVSNLLNTCVCLIRANLKYFEASLLDLISN